MKIEGNKTNVAVIFGGKSVEHDISIITGVQTLNNLDKQKYNIFPIYITKEGKWLYSQNFFDIKVFTKDIKFLSDVKPVSLSTFNSSLFIVKAKKQKLLTKLDFAFLATHGAMGENGSLQGYLDMCNLPYTSCGVESSAVCMNKALTKLVLEKNDVESTKYTVLTPDDYKKGFVHILKQINNLVFPLVVKPSNLGSSIGINLCKNKTSLKNAISFAFLFDNLVIVEEAVQNLREFNIAVMGNSVKQELSDIEEVFSKNEFLTFESKYLNNSNSKGMEATDRKIPALITEETKEIIQTSALKIFKYLGCSGIVRIDFLYDSKQNKIYLNELNTIPGSLANYLWKSKKLTFAKLLEKLMEYAMQENLLRSKKITNFSSNVLSKFDGNKKLEVLK